MTGGSAFARLFTELTSAMEVDLPGREEPAPLMEALSLLQSPDRDQRRTAAEGVTAALQPGLRTRAYIFNTLLQDKSTKDRLRSYPHWLASRNLANEASDESVTALVDAVVGRYELARRWYTLKARLLGLEKLAYYDRMAPVAEAEQHVPYDEAKATVLDCYRDFSGELGDVAAAFFDGSFIDAPPQAGKQGGAFCAYTVPSAHPYVMLNYTSRPGDVLTMAHELGHGVHAALARPKGMFEFTTPLTVAETASIFGETIVLERLLDEAPDAAARLSLLAESLDGAVAAVFRQIAMNRFEHRIHSERRESGELSTDAFAAAWSDTQARPAGRFGRAVRGVRVVVVLRAALREHARLRVRVRLRPPAGAVGLPPVRGGGPGLHPRLPGPAARRRLDAARGAGQDRGRGPGRPGLLELGPGPDRAPAGPGREGGGGSRPRLTRWPTTSRPGATCSSPAPARRPR